MFWLLCPSLSHASYYITVCINIYLHEVFPTKVKWCLNSQFLSGSIVRLISELRLSTEDLCAK